MTSGEEAHDGKSTIMLNNKYAFTHQKYVARNKGQVQKFNVNHHKMAGINLNLVNNEKSKARARIS